jgi:hypothetical protein
MCDCFSITPESEDLITGLMSPMPCVFVCGVMDLDVTPERPPPMKLTECPLSEVESNDIHGERSAPPTGRDWSAPRRMRYPVCKGRAAFPVSPTPLPQTAASETAGLNTRSSVWPSRFVSS